MQIENEIKLDFKDVLIRPKRSTLGSRSEVSLHRSFKRMGKSSETIISGVPIVAANMDGVGTMSMARVLASHGCFTALTKHYPLDELVPFFKEPKIFDYVFYSLGTSSKDKEKFDIFKSRITNPTIKVCIDVANGYSEKFISFVKQFRQENPWAVIMAGNVVTKEITEELILAGVDIVKVGIGPGSVCTTRKMTGVGYPQLSAVIECADAAHGLGGLICSDGGCTVPGDVAKAFGAGADLVMLGGMLAGHTESDGEITNLDISIHKDVTLEDHDMAGMYAIFRGKTYAIPYWPETKEGNRQAILGVLPPEAIIKTPTVNSKVKFYGMSSAEAMNKHNGGVAEYRASEGKVVEIPYRGPVDNTIKEILGGVRSTLTYTGSKELKELSKRTTFIRVNTQLNEVFGKS